MKVVVADPLPISAIELLRRVPGWTVDARRGTTPADIPDEAWRACDAIVIWQVMNLRADTIAKLDNCRIIARAGVGFDGIDLAAAAKKGIAVCNCPDYGTTDVADHAIALYLALSRGVAFFQDALLKARWSEDQSATTPVRPDGRESRAAV